MGPGPSVDIMWLGALQVLYGALQTRPVGHKLPTDHIQGLGFRVWGRPTGPTEGPTERPAPRGAHKTLMQGA